MIQYPAIENLLNGYRRFHRRYFRRQAALFEQLKEGQAPKTLIITCSDSRVSPTIITQAGPGDLFVIRNVANLVPPYQPGAPESLHGVSAALEFGVCSLGVEHIIVMGHSGCSGIRALMEGPPLPEDGFSFIGPWMKVASPAREKALQQPVDERQRCCEQEAVKVSLANLLTFPWIARRVEGGKLALHGWYFRIDDGALMGYDPAADQYAPLAAPAF